jgi:hypothetical protein
MSSATTGDKAKATRRAIFNISPPPTSSAAPTLAQRRTSRPTVREHFDIPRMGAQEHQQPTPFAVDRASGVRGIVWKLTSAEDSKHPSRTV